MTIQLPKVIAFLGFAMLDKIIVILKMEIFPTTVIKNIIRTFKWRLSNFTIFNVTMTVGAFHNNTIKVDKFLEKPISLDKLKNEIKMLIE